MRYWWRHYQTPAEQLPNSWNFSNKLLQHQICSCEKMTGCKNLNLLGKSCGTWQFIYQNNTSGQIKTIPDGSCPEYGKEICSKSRIWLCCIFFTWKVIQKMRLMRYWGVLVCASACVSVCVSLCRWRWLNERASCFCRDDLHRADGSVSQSLRSQSCPTLLLTPHLTADFLPAHHKPTKTHTHTIRGERAAKTVWGSRPQRCA